MPAVSRMLDECAQHLARDRHEQMRRIAERNPLAGYDGPPLSWESLGQDTRQLEVSTMRSLLYRGVIVCTRREHRVRISLRQPRDPA